MTCTQHNKFQCPNGRCINISNVCDGICDCLRSADGFCPDETNCTQFYKEIDGMVFFIRISDIFQFSIVNNNYKQLLNIMQVQIEYLYLCKIFNK